MSSSAPDPHEAAGSSPPVSARPQSRSDQPHGRALFESVLRQTLQDSSPGADLDDAEKADLTKVVQRHRAEPFALEPIAVELVYAVLRGHFQQNSSSSEFWRGVAAQVAQSLFDDPVAHDRLEAFWRRLCSAIS